MFSKDNLTRYLIDAGLDVEALTIMEVSHGEYTVFSPDAETTQKVLEQVDRDEEHPVVMKGVEVFTKVIKQPDTIENPNDRLITINVQEVVPQ